jgi:hypothetical protein
LLLRLECKLLQMMDEKNMCCWPTLFIPMVSSMSSHCLSLSQYLDEAKKSLQLTGVKAQTWWTEYAV